MNFDTLYAELRAQGHPQRAAQMRAYMRDLHPFLGIQSPQRRAVTRPHFAALRRATQIDWCFVERCWDCEYRELQYVAIDYLNRVKRLLTPDDLGRLHALAQRKSWWDTIDGLDTLVGEITLRHPAAKATILAWSLDEDFWIRRIAIDHQLKHKDRTDTELLAAIIRNNLGDTEFFINKAIGWALREYSKTDPAWVRGFISEHHTQLAPLSIREGSKHLPQDPAETATPKS